MYLQAFQFDIENPIDLKSVQEFQCLDRQQAELYFSTLDQVQDLATVKSKQSHSFPSMQDEFIKSLLHFH